MSVNLLSGEELLEEYRRDRVRLALTNLRLIAETPSARLFGVRVKSTIVFLEDLDAIEWDFHSHPWLAQLGALTFLLGWISPDAREPLGLIALALVTAFFITRRRGVKFNTGRTMIFVEAADDGTDEALERFVQAVQGTKALRWSG